MSKGGGRLGAAAIFGAKIYFLFVSMGLGFLLITKLDPVQFGRYFLVNDVVGMVGAVLIAGVLQSISRQVAQNPDRVHDIRAAGLRTIGKLGATVTVLLAVLSWPMAAALGDTSLAPLFLFVAPIPFCYALYATNIGIFNGLKRFSLQASFDVGFVTLKAGLMIGAAIAGFGAAGVLGGFAAATVAAFVVSTPLSRSGTPKKPFAGKDILAFSLLTLAFVFAINLVLRVDTWLVKRAFDDTAVGLYGVSLQVARIPYQLSVAVALVMFPFLASRRETGSDPVAREYVERALRYGLILAATVAALLVGSGKEFLHLLDPRKAVAAQLLLLTGPAMLAYTLTYLTTTVLVSLGKPGRATVVAAAVVVLNVGLAHLWIHHPRIFLRPPGGGIEDGLLGAAQGVLVANLIGMVLGFVFLARATGFRPTVRFVGALAVAAALTFAGLFWQLDVEDVGRVALAGGLVLKVAALGLAAAVAFVALRIAPIGELRQMVLGKRG